MYLPLKFMEQMEHCYTIQNKPFMNGLFSSKSLALFKSMGTAKCLDLFMGNGDITRSNKKHHKALGIQSMNNTDFAHMCMYSAVYNQWRDNKVVYSLDNDLCSKFMEMDLPETVPTAVLTKLPFGCFYVDLCGTQAYMEDAHGFFVTASMSEDQKTYNIGLLSLVESNKALYVQTRLVLNAEDVKHSDLVDMSKVYDCATIDIEMEDGKTRTLNEQLFFKLVFNFLMYLQACNKDVEISDRTKEIKKQYSTPKNKISDVTEYSVGLRKASTVSRHVKCRYKYSKEDVREHRSLRGHYRAAHWHTYWRGTAGNKERVIKWIDVLYVNGTKCDDVIIHKVR